MRQTLRGGLSVSSGASLLSAALVLCDAETEEFKLTLLDLGFGNSEVDFCWNCWGLKAEAMPTNSIAKERAYIFIIDEATS